jgi:carbamoyltransferase
MFGAKPWILGTSSAFHNGAACLLHGDKIVAAIQEERLSRVKRERLFLDRTDRPSRAIDYCLAAAGIKPTDLDCVVDSTIVAPSESPEAALRNSHILRVARSGVDSFSVSHHLAHAISAFATSGFSESAVLVVDGGGSFAEHLPESERAAALTINDGMCEHLSIYHSTGKGIHAVEKHFASMPYLSEGEWQAMPRFASFGHMFSSAAFQIFGDYLEAGKVMGLAPCGRATIPARDFFQRAGLEFDFLGQVPERFKGSERWPVRHDEYADLAASTQRALEAGLQEVVARLESLRLSENLSYAGGVALNGVANHNVLQRSRFKNLYVIPAAEDSGTAIGAAYFGLMQLRPPQRKRLCHDFLGRVYTSPEIDAAIATMEGVKIVETKDVLDSTVDLLGEGKVIGWFQGGAEFGPRALGHRSILFDPRRDDARAILNEKVKFREPYRPFAPAVLAEHMRDWFETDAKDDLFDFMLEVCPFRKELPGPAVPGVTHVDGTGRPQRVSVKDNPRFYELIRKFYARTGVPMIINTSFNIAGEPIVETPAHALSCLLRSGLDYCVLEDRLVQKK